MERRREIRDPIHGFIYRTETEQKLMDTQVFQRLRGIKQLALANLVYPGAMHTRFDHSVGVMHVAGRMAEQLTDSRELVELARVTALLHDVGHGPFSHVSEDILDRYYDQTKVKSKAKEKIHEQVTCSIIEKSQEIADILPKWQREKVIGLLLGNAGEQIAKDIISGPLDADKQDYLLRDSYFCGVKYGVFDLERLIGTLEGHRQDHEPTLVASSDGVYAVEQFVIAKYHMTQQVYRHKIRLATDAMIVRALELGIEEDRLDWLIRLYAYDGSEEYIQNFLEWDDARLMTSLVHPLKIEGLATELFRALRDRKLFKVVLDSSLRKDFTNPTTRDILSNIGSNTRLLKRAEQEIAEILAKDLDMKVNAHHVVVKGLATKSIREQSVNNERQILIKTPTGIIPFDQASLLFESLNAGLGDPRILVYAPVNLPDPATKVQRMEELGQKVRECLSKLAELEATVVGDEEGGENGIRADSRQDNSVTT
jgi:uncharacterized protein